MTPDEYRQKYKNCNTCIYYNDFSLCKIKREDIPSCKKPLKNVNAINLFHLSLRRKKNEKIKFKKPNDCRMPKR